MYILNLDVCAVPIYINIYKYGHSAWAYEKTIFRVQVLQVHLELRAAEQHPSGDLFRRTTVSRKLLILRTKYSIIVQLLGS